MLKVVAILSIYLNNNKKVFITSYTVPILAENLKWFIKILISYRETKIYKNLANFINWKNRYSAVGMVNSKKPIPTTIPYHRAINYNGTLSGFSYKLNLKIKLPNIKKLYKN